MVENYNIVKNKNGTFVTNKNVVYNTKSLNKLNSKLVEINANQLNKLLIKYTKIEKLVKDKGLTFGGKQINAIAVTSHSYDMRRLGIHLSNEYYNNYNKYHKIIADRVKDSWFMPCSNNSIDTYALNYEFGRLVENYLINKYNINNLDEYLNYKTKIRTATNQYQVENAIKDYEGKICDKISQNIYDIALKNNKDFKLIDSLSRYGYENSKEFFAECFANMESGKLNELGRAMKEYLKGVM